MGTPFGAQKSHWGLPGGYRSLQWCVFEGAFSGPTFYTKSSTQNWSKNMFFWTAWHGWNTVDSVWNSNLHVFAGLICPKLFWVPFWGSSGGPFRDLFGSIFGSEFWIVFWSLLGAPWAPLYAPWASLGAESEEKTILWKEKMKVKLMSLIIIPFFILIIKLIIPISELKTK